MSYRMSYCKNKPAVLGWLLLVFLLGPAWTGSAVADETTRVPLPRLNITKGEQCVEPTDVMRRQHMVFILHQRDKTMLKGIRTKKYSLKNCVNCHADPETKSVLGEEGFCSSCHSYAAVQIDCFSCHSDKAEPEERAAKIGPGATGSSKVTAGTGDVQ